MPEKKDESVRLSLLASVREQFTDHIAVIRNLTERAGEIEQIAGVMTSCLLTGGKICWMGNGGSAADSQHLAAEFVGRFKHTRASLASLALTTDTSVLTAISNDFGFEQVFARQIEGLCSGRDVVVGISTSGESANVVLGLEQARRMGAVTIGFTGQRVGRVAECASYCIAVPSNETARIQEAHITVGHILCELVERKLQLGTS